MPFIFVSKFEIWRAPCKSSDNTIDKNTWVKINTINNDHTETNNADFAYSDSLANGGYCYGMHVYSTYDEALFTTEKDSNIPLAYVFSDDTAPTISEFLVNDKAGGLSSPDIVVAPLAPVKISWKATDGGGGSGIARVEILCNKGMQWAGCSENITAVKLARGTLTDGSYNFTIPFQTEMTFDLGIHVVKNNGKWVSEQGSGLSPVRIKIEKECVPTRTCANFDLTTFCGSKNFDNGCNVNIPCPGTLSCPNGCNANSCIVAAPTPTPPPTNTTSPTISEFNIDPVSFVEKESANIYWKAEDHSGSGLDRVEIWIKRAEESWSAEPTIINKNMTIKNYNYIMPDAGTFDFGIHVVDKKGNMTKESALIKVTVTSNADSSGSCGGVATVPDIEGNIYSTVAIGTQCWMKSNMRTAKYPDGTAIAKGCSTAGCGNWKSDASYYSCPPDTSYGGKRESCAAAARVGMLYQWSAAMNGSTSEGAQGICPSGWHVPLDAEWDTLITNLGGANAAGNKLKQTTGWSTPNIGTNSSGFTALPAGNRDQDSYYYGFFDYAHFWSSGTNPFIRQLNSANGSVSRRDYTNLKGNGISVRCLKGAATDEYQSTANGSNNNAANNNKNTVLPTISNAYLSVIALGTGEYVFSIASSPYPYEKKKPLVYLNWEVSNSDPAAAFIEKFVISRAPKNTTQWTVLGEDGKDASGKYQRIDRSLLDATKEYQYKIDVFMKEADGPQASQIVKTDGWISDSDGDGLSDWEENYVFSFLDTTDPAQPRIIHTDPMKADTDGDTFSDYDEITNCYSPFSKNKYNTGCVK